MRRRGLAAAARRPTPPRPSSPLPPDVVPPATAPLYFERESWSAGCRHVVGVDEAGYGPLAGPVVVAAVALVPGQGFDGVTDSKLLSPSRREELADLIRDGAFAWRVAAASPREIERLNARGATCLAMRRAVGRLPFEPDRLLVDGLRAPGLPEHTPVVRGDSRSHSIACASILAKVFRDRLMCRLAPRYPAYGWDRNKGYRSPEHLEALREHGPTPHHRTTFRGVLQGELVLGDGSSPAEDGC